MDIVSNLFEGIKSGGCVVSIFLVIVGIGVLKALSDNFKLKGIKEGYSLNYVRAINSILNIGMFAFLIFCAKEISLPWLLDVPYMLSGEEPYYYGEAVGNYERGGETGVKNTETEEILFVRNWLSRNSDETQFIKHNVEKGPMWKFFIYPIQGCMD